MTATFRVVCATCVALLIAALVILVGVYARRQFFTDGFTTVREQGQEQGQAKAPPSYISPSLIGGLGNQLFELATAYALQTELAKPLKIRVGDIHKSEHSDKNYMSTIFRAFSEDVIHPASNEPSITLSTPLTSQQLEGAAAATDTAIILKPYNHDWRHIEPHRAEFVSVLNFEEGERVARSYDRLADSVFIHIRGGDFKGLAYLNVGLHSYYKAAVDYVKAHGVQHAYVFTNDKAYAATYAALNAIKHTYVDENELVSLYLMSRCGRGGITGNSTYGWWGLYLNLDRPYLIMPDKWVVDAHRPVDYVFDFAFPRAKKISTV